MVSPTHPSIRWTAPVARWSSWRATSGSAESSSIDLSFADPLLRRRLSPLAKAALAVAFRCAPADGPIRFVFASRHGDLRRTTAMLVDLADDAPLSPTAFSMSVLNAAAGLFSIIRHDAEPGTAISAGLESFGYGLLEASLQYTESPYSPVLFVFADEPAPILYDCCPPDEDEIIAVALLLDANAERRINCVCEPVPGPDSTETQALAFLRHLDDTATTAAWHGEGRDWTWNTI